MSEWQNIKIGKSTGVIKDNPDHIDIASIRTPSAHRGQGGAHAVMKHIVDYADSINKPARLVASPLDKKTRTDKLVSFYQKYGFEPTGEKANQVGDPWMERPAQVIKKADGGSVDQQNLTAYHGSPHDFDQFKTSQIGTGEGAQSFGHGLYFAQNEGVAKNYRDKLAGQDTYMIDHILEHAPELKNADRDTQMDLHKWAMNEKHDPYSAAKWAQAGNSRLREFDQNRIANVLASYRNASRGHMYEVGIKAHPHDFLDWDEYKFNQPNKVTQVVSKLIEDKINKENPSDEKKYQYVSPVLTGRQLYSLIHEDPKEASKLLHAHGIKGIKYLDERSRFSDDDDDKTYNYVVFNDKDVHIKRKYAHGGDVERKHYVDGGGTDGGGGGDTAGGPGTGGALGSGDGPQGGEGGHDGGGGGGGDSGYGAAPEVVAQQQEQKKPDPIAPKPLTPENMGLNLGYSGDLKPTIVGAMPTPYADGGIVDAALRKVNSKYSPEGLPLSAMEILSKIARTG